MKIVKKILLVLVILIVLSSLGGYFYFQKKFTPPENQLKIVGLAGSVPLTWLATENNPISALLPPVKIKGLPQQFFMQLDCGSPVTVFYSKPLESIRTKFQQHIAPPDSHAEVSLTFTIGNMEVSSDKFRLLNYGKPIEWDSLKAHHIIGTIGTDLFEKRVVVLDFRNNASAFLGEVPQHGMAEFAFEKRRILFPGKVENKDLKFLFDSGTSAYQLITSKEEWEKYRISNGEIKSEKGNSWGNILTINTAPAEAKIQMGNNTMDLTQVTYIEGTSTVQNLLMRFSGMQGMIGCKLFLNRKITLDCKNQKFKVE